jgi:hypothetical protein
VRPATALPSHFDEWDLNPAELPLIIGKELENDLYAGLGKKHAMGESAVLAIKMLGSGAPSMETSPVTLICSS